MDLFPKINALYKRHTEGKKKGKFIVGEFAAPEFEYLFSNQWEWTEKVDGTNIRIGLRRLDDHTLNVEYGGRTDNAQIPAHLLQALDALFPQHPTKAMPGSRERLILDWMIDADITYAVLFGEGYGPKIQNGGKYREDAGFVLFDVKIGDFWLRRHNVNKVAGSLGLDSVPVLHYGTVQDAIDIVSSGYIFTKDGGIKRFGRNGLESTWGKFEAEGLIGRPVVSLFNNKGERVTVKIKAVDFK